MIELQYSESVQHANYCKNFLMEELPCELLPRILLNLDSFSLRSLLRAFPGIARKCILLFEEWKTNYTYTDRRENVSAFCCFFYECDGLRKLPFSQYNPQLHKSYFKIYEACGLTNGDPRLDMSLQDRFPYLNKQDSYVHYFSRTSSLRMELRCCKIDGFQLLQEHKLSASLRQGGYAFQTTPILQKEKEFYLLPTRSILSNLFPCHTSACITAIRLEGIERIESFTLPTSVTTLTVVFNKSLQKPVIRNLTLTRHDEHFRGVKLNIYYHDRVPFIEGLGIPLFSPEYVYPLDCLSICNILLLAHIPSLAGNLTNALPPHPDENDDFSDLTRELSGKFAHINIIGGPNGLFNCLDLSKDSTCSLYFKQTCQYLSSEHKLIDITGNLRELQTFRFESVLDNPTVPAILEYEVGFHMIYITSHHGLDLSRFSSRLSYHVRPLHLLYIEVACQSSTDYVSSMEDLSESIQYLSPNQLYGLGIVGTRRSEKVDEEALKRKVHESTTPGYQGCTVSLID